MLHQNDVTSSRGDDIPEVVRLYQPQNVTKTMHDTDYKEGDTSQGSS